MRCYFLFRTNLADIGFVAQPTQNSQKKYALCELLQALRRSLFLITEVINNILLYYGAVECLNLIGWRTFWCVQLFSGKRRANVIPGSSLDRITVPYHFAKLFLLFQRSYNRKITKTHNDTGQTNKYSKQKDNIDRSHRQSINRF